MSTQYPHAHQGCTDQGNTAPVNQREAPHGKFINGIFVFYMKPLSISIWIPLT